MTETRNDTGCAVGPSAAGPPSLGHRPRQPADGIAAALAELLSQTPLNAIFIYSTVDWRTTPY